jgi:hypothetical protein
MFRRARVVYMSDVYEKVFATVIPPNTDMVRSFLEEVAERRQGQGWRFRLEDDSEFEATHAGIVRNEEQLWDDRIREASVVMAGDGSQGARLSRARGASDMDRR